MYSIFFGRIGISGGSSFSSDKIQNRPDIIRYPTVILSPALSHDTSPPYRKGLARIAMQRMPMDNSLKESSIVNISQKRRGYSTQLVSYQQSVDRSTSSRNNKYRRDSSVEELASRRRGENIERNTSVEKSISHRQCCRRTILGRGSGRGVGRFWKFAFSTL